MDPVTASLAVLNAILGASASSAATGVAAQNLQFQKQQAADQRRLATAARPDAYGNVTSFNDILNEWDIELTPMQQMIVDAMQSEQYKSLTEDATRNRAARVRADDRSKVADEDYADARIGYLYDQPESEGSAQNEAVGDIINAMSGRVGGDTERLARSALRTGGNRYEDVLSAAARTRGGELGDNILQGKALGTQRATAGRAAHEGRYGPMLDRFLGAANNSPQAGVRFTDPSKDSTISSMAAALQSAISSGSQGVGGAFSDLSRMTANSAIDLSEIIKLLSQSGDEESSFAANIVDPYSTSQSRTNPYLPQPGLSSPFVR